MTNGWEPNYELIKELGKSTEEIFRVIPVGQIEPDILDEMLLRTAVNFNRLKQEDQDNFFPIYAVLIEICTGAIMQNHQRSYLGPGYATYSWEEYREHLEETKRLEEDLSYEGRLACDKYEELLQWTFLAVAKGHCKIKAPEEDQENERHGINFSRNIDREHRQQTHATGVVRLLFRHEEGAFGNMFQDALYWRLRLGRSMAKRMLGCRSSIIKILRACVRGFWH